MEVDTPDAAVTLRDPGNYRFFVDQGGDTTVVVERGSADALVGGQDYPLSQGTCVRFTGADNPSPDYESIPPPDGFDRWALAREDRGDRGYSRPYADAYIVGLSDLDDYGRWDNLPGYGWGWTPFSVSVDWAPFRLGRWIWEDPWGWTWIDGEPWGWAPCHYGRWSFFESRWYWLPGSFGEARVSYAPAMVAFVGGGPGWSVSVGFGGGGYVGWFPLGPGDPFNPWWGPCRGFNRYEPRRTYVNQNFVTVVNNNTFISGGNVARSYVRDTRVVQESRQAPVIRGPLPLVPTAGATRVALAVSRRGGIRPPERALTRPVVTRTTPPPPPPTFAVKREMIQASHGAPLSPAALSSASGQDQARLRVTPPTRPALKPGQESPYRNHAEITPAQPRCSSTGTATVSPRGEGNQRIERPYGSSQGTINPSSAGERQARGESPRAYPQVTPKYEKPKEKSTTMVNPVPTKRSHEKHARESTESTVQNQAVPRQPSRHDQTVVRETRKPSSARTMKEARPETPPVRIRQSSAPSYKSPVKGGDRGQKVQKVKPSKQMNQNPHEPMDQQHD